MTWACPAGTPKPPQVRDLIKPTCKLLGEMKEPGYPKLSIYRLLISRLIYLLSINCFGKKVICSTGRWRLCSFSSCEERSLDVGWVAFLECRVFGHKLDHRAKLASSSDNTTQASTAGKAQIHLTMSCLRGLPRPPAQFKMQGHQHSWAASFLLAEGHCGIPADNSPSTRRHLVSLAG